jgi:hypothetical protein
MSDSGRILVDTWRKSERGRGPDVIFDRADMIGLLHSLGFIRAINAIQFSGVVHTGKTAVQERRLKLPYAHHILRPRVTTSDYSTEQLWRTVLEAVQSSRALDAQTPRHWLNKPLPSVLATSLPEEYGLWTKVRSEAPNGSVRLLGRGRKALKRYLNRRRLFGGRFLFHGSMDPSVAVFKPRIPHGIATRPDGSIILYDKGLVFATLVLDLAIFHATVVRRGAARTQVKIDSQSRR